MFIRKKRAQVWGEMNNKGLIIMLNKNVMHVLLRNMLSVHESMNDDGIATKTHGERDDMALLVEKQKTAVNLGSVLNNDRGSLEHHQIGSSRILTTLCGGTNIATEAWLSYIFRTLPTNLPRSHQTKVKTSFTTPPFLQVLREFSDFFSSKSSSMDSMVYWILKMPTQNPKKERKTHSSSSEFPARDRLVIKLVGVKAVPESSCHGSSLEHSIGNPWICDTFQTRRGNGLWKQSLGGKFGNAGETMYMSLHLPYKSAKYR